MDFQYVFTVLERIRETQLVRRQFARLADRHETGTQFIGQRRAKDPTARFDRGDDVDIRIDVPLDHCIDSFLEGLAIADESGDITEENALDGEIGDTANEAVPAP